MRYIYVISGSHDGVIGATTSRTDAIVKALNYMNISPKSSQGHAEIVLAFKAFHFLLVNQGLDHGSVTMGQRLSPNSDTVEIQVFTQ